MHFVGHVILILGFMYGLYMLISFVTKKTKFDLLFQNGKGKGIKGKYVENKKRSYKY